MRSLKSRVTKLERTINNQKNMPITIEPVFLGNADWREKENLIKEKYFTENGTLNGLKIVRHWIPNPDPLPSAFRKSQDEAE